VAETPSLVLFSFPLIGWNFFLKKKPEGNYVISYISIQFDENQNGRFKLKNFEALKG
jgi:hypothetical protein